MTDTEHDGHHEANPRQQRITAAHIAGTAVMARILGRAVSCELHPCGCGGVELGAPQGNAEDDLFLPAMAFVQAAKAMQLDPDDFMVDERGQDDRDRLVQAVHLLWHQHFDGALEDEDEDHALANVLTMIKVVLEHEENTGLQPAIDAVAQAVRLRKTLTHQQIEGLIKDHLQGFSIQCPPVLPELVFPWMEEVPPRKRPKIVRASAQKRARKQAKQARKKARRR